MNDKNLSLFRTNRIRISDLEDLVGKDNLDLLEYFGFGERVGQKFAAITNAGFNANTIFVLVDEINQFYQCIYDQSDCSFIGDY